MNSQSATPRRCWLAAYTRAHHEHRVAAQFRQKQLEFLLPTYERLVRWSDRIKRSQPPLFPGYVFVHVSHDEQVPVLETSGVVQFVLVAGRPAVLQREDVERLQFWSAHPRDLEPHPYLRVGQRVRVKHGPFAGWEGKLAEKQNSYRLIVTFEQIRKSVAINLHGADVEPVI